MSDKDLSTKYLWWEKRHFRVVYPTISGKKVSPIPPYDPERPDSTRAKSVGNPTKRGFMVSETPPKPGIWYWSRAGRPLKNWCVIYPTMALKRADSLENERRLPHQKETAAHQFGANSRRLPHLMAFKLSSLPPSTAAIWQSQAFRMRRLNSVISPTITLLAASTMPAIASPVATTKWNS